MKNIILNNYVNAFINEVKTLINVKEQDIILLKNLIIKYESPNWAIQQFILEEYVPYNLVCIIIKKLVDILGNPITDIKEWKVFKHQQMEYRFLDNKIIGFPGFGSWDRTLEETIQIEGTLSCYYTRDHMCPYTEYVLKYNNTYIISDSNSFRRSYKKGDL